MITRMNQVTADIVIGKILPSGVGFLPDKISISAVAPSIILFSKTKKASAMSVAAKLLDASLQNNG